MADLNARRRLLLVAVVAILPVLLEDEPDPVRYHDSMLTGERFCRELLDSPNPHRFRETLVMDRSTFLKTRAGLVDSTHLSAEKK